MSTYRVKEQGKPCVKSEAPKRGQSNRVNTVTQGAIESVRVNGCRRIKRVEFSENVRAFFPRGQSKLSMTKHNDVSVLNGCS